MTIYDYHDESGKRLFQSVKIPLPDGGKTFYQRHEDPENPGRWINNLKGIRKTLYRLPELLAADPTTPVYVVEGEKDVDRLVSLGFVATTNPAGGKNWKSEYASFLRGRKVVILPDNDETGRKHKKDITESLRDIATMKVVELPDLPEKGDVSDWLDDGHTADELRQIVKSAPAYAPPPPSDEIEFKGTEQKKPKPRQTVDRSFQPLDIEGDILPMLSGVKYTGNGWKAICPAHNDKNPSLSVDLGDDGRILIHCFAGCTCDEVCASLGIDQARLFPTPLERPQKHKARTDEAYLILGKTPEVKGETPSTPEPLRVEMKPERSKKLILSRMSDFVETEVTWLWDARIPYGKITIIAGDPGLGKSFLTMDMAARVSTGAPMPQENKNAYQEKREPADVILLCAEDDPSDTIRPRLRKAGADLDKVHLLQAKIETRPDGTTAERTVSMKDIPTLEEAVRDRPGTKLIIIDPVSAYTGGNDSNHGDEVRELTTPLKALAERHGIAVVLVQHLNKSSPKAGNKALYRMTGSIGWIGAARCGHLLAMDPDDKTRRFFIPIKNNLAPLAMTLGYRMPDGVVTWEDTGIDIDADELLTRAPEREPGKYEDAIEFLRETLSGGPRPANDIQEAAKSLGIGERTLRTAKKELDRKSVV